MWKISTLYTLFHRRAFPSGVFSEGWNTLGLHGVSTTIRFNLFISKLFFLKKTWVQMVTRYRFER